MWVDVTCLLVYFFLARDRSWIRLSTVQVKIRNVELCIFASKFCVKIEMVLNILSFSKILTAFGGGNDSK